MVASWCHRGVVLPAELGLTGKRLLLSTAPSLWGSVLLRGVHESERTIARLTNACEINTLFHKVVTEHFRRSFDSAAQLYALRHRDREDELYYYNKEKGK